VSRGKLHNPSAAERDGVRGAITVELSRQPGIGFAYLFGSFISPLPFHDVDVGVYFRAPEPARDPVGLADRLGARIGLPVDVRALNTAPVSFLYEVLKGQLLVSTDEELWAAVVEDTVRRYLDIAPLLRHYTKEAFGE